MQERIQREAIIVGSSDKIEVSRSKNQKGVSSSSASINVYSYSGIIFKIKTHHEEIVFKTRYLYWKKCFKHFFAQKTLVIK